MTETRGTIKGAVGRWRNNICPHGNTSYFSNLWGYFASGQHAPMGWFCPLGKFDFNHFDFAFLGFGDEFILAECPFLFIPNTKITRTDLQADITTLHMVRTQAPFPGVMVKAAFFGALIKCHQRIWRKRSK